MRKGVSGVKFEPSEDRSGRLQDVLFALKMAAGLQSHWSADCYDAPSYHLGHLVMVVRCLSHFLPWLLVRVSRENCGQYRSSLVCHNQPHHALSPISWLS